MSIAEIQAPDLPATPELPAHVPLERVVDYDFYRVGPGFRDFHEESGALVAERPAIFYTLKNGGHWVITRYELLSKFSRDTDLFSNVPYTIPTFEGEPKLAPVFTDPPEHTQYRKVLNRVFTPSAALALKGAIHERAAELIEAVAGQGRCEFVESVSEVLPVSILMDLLGLPRERLRDYRKYVKLALGSQDPQGKREGYALIEAEMREVIEERAVTPGSDMISSMFEADMGARRPNRDEILNLCMMLFAAGLDTVTVTMAYGIRHLAQDQVLQAQLRVSPSLIEAATEELLRRYSVALPARTMTRDTELEGVTLKAGDRVLMLVSAGGLDPGAYPDPMRVDFDRVRRPHLAFFAGPHRCVGMHLARIELQVLYEEWLARIPPFRIDESVPQDFGGGHVLSIHNLPLRWD